jgi:hypothetical protein
LEAEVLLIPYGRLADEPTTIIVLELAYSRIDLSDRDEKRAIFLVQIQIVTEAIRVRLRFCGRGKINEKEVIMPMQVDFTTDEWHLILRGPL